MGDDAAHAVPSLAEARTRARRPRTAGAPPEAHDAGHDRREQRAGLATAVLRTLLGLAVVVALAAGIFFGAAAIEGDEPSQLAPWSSGSAPDVAPARLADQ